MEREHERINKHARLRAARVPVLAALTIPRMGKSSLLDLLLKSGMSPRQISLGELADHYEKLCKRLRLPEGHFTTNELGFRKILGRATKMKFHPNMWIGGINVDLFFMQIAMDQPIVGDMKRRTSHIGLAIEIDGGIHNSEPKMKKDAWKIDYLASLGIALVSISNDDFNEVTVRRFVKGLPGLRQRGTRGRRRLLARVHLETLAYHLKGDELEGIFGINPDNTVAVLKVYSQTNQKFSQKLTARCSHDS